MTWRWMVAGALLTTAFGCSSAPPQTNATRYLEGTRQLGRVGEQTCLTITETELQSDCRYWNAVATMQAGELDLGQALCEGIVSDAWRWDCWEQWVIIADPTLGTAVEGCSHTGPLFQDCARHAVTEMITDTHAAPGNEAQLIVTVASWLAEFWAQRPPEANVDADSMEIVAAQLVLARVSKRLEAQLQCDEDHHPCTWTPTPLSHAACGATHIEFCSRAWVLAMLQDHVHHGIFSEHASLCEFLPMWPTMEGTEAIVAAASSMVCSEPTDDVSTLRHRAKMGPMTVLGSPPEP